MVKGAKMKDVVLLTGAGQIGMAIARRIGYGKKIIVGDKKLANAEMVAKTMNEAGFDVVPVVCDISSRESILQLIAEGQKYGEIAYQMAKRCNRFLLRSTETVKGVQRRTVKRLTVRRLCYFMYCCRVFKNISAGFENT